MPGACDGMPCGLTYDQVTWAGAHNAMSTAAAGFTTVQQHRSLTQQLDAGIRELDLDAHAWDEPVDRAAVVARLPSAVRAITGDLLDQEAAEPHPGVFLCHTICQLGSTPAVAALQPVRAWVAAHAQAVVTIVIEDHVAVAPVEEVLSRAGLDPYLATPPDSPVGTWPTLGRMVATGHRVVVLAERRDGGAGSPYRNVFRYAAETPYDATSPGGLTCALGRGPAEPERLVLNHFLAEPGDASGLNTSADILGQARRCLMARGARSAYLVVDDADVGDVVGAAHELTAEQAAR